MPHRSVYWHRFLGFFMIGILSLAGLLLVAFGIAFLCTSFGDWGILIFGVIVVAAFSAMAALS